jgi:hypothetical protein
MTAQRRTARLTRRGAALRNWTLFGLALLGIWLLAYVAAHLFGVAGTPDF